MKVAERDTDRQARVNLYIDGEVKEVAEYGEHVDPHDGALCCYVPVEEDERLKIGGRFTGTTLTVAWDAVVDGVYRKAASTTAKSVNAQKKNLNVEKFLFKTEDGVVDTDMMVTKLPRVQPIPGDAPDKIGTIELYLYVLRNLGDEHQLHEVRTYYDTNEKDRVREYSKALSATYNRVAPEHVMRFEKNCAVLEKKKTNREKRKMDSKRPGTGPWAIFRFYYRSKRSLIEHDLEITHDPKNKKLKEQPYYLQLEPVPPLRSLSRPLTSAEWDTSTRASTPIHSEPPQTPVKPITEHEILEVPPSGKINRTESVMSPQSTNSFASLLSPDQTVKDTRPQMLLAEGIPRTAVMASESAPDEIAAKSQAVWDLVKTHISEENKTKMGEPKGNTSVEAYDVFSLQVCDADTAASVHNPTDTNGIHNGDKIHDDSENRLTTTEPNLDNPTERPDTSATAPKGSAVQENPVTSSKRTPETTTIENPPQPKRVKITTPTNHSSPPSLSTSTPLEKQVAEMRKRLKQAKKDRALSAEKLSKCDEKLAPYQQRLKDELERLSELVQEEENAYAANEEQILAKEEMLREFEEGGGEA